MLTHRSDGGLAQWYARFVRTDYDIKEAVRKWCASSTVYRRGRVIHYYGHISDWDTFHVTSMATLFEEKTSFNDDISRWDVRNVVNMQSMFLEAKKFNQDISGWKVNKVQDMCMMFCDASSFNQNLNGWKPGEVRDKRLMWKGSGLDHTRPLWAKRTMVSTNY